MTLGNRIAAYRKEKGMTQEALARELNITNQAVSKWETDQCCPDIEQLPALSDLFGISVDVLLGRPDRTCTTAPGLPWEDDNTIRIVVMQGHRLLKQYEGAKEMTFHFNGEANNVECALNLNCDQVSGDVKAGGTVNCDCVHGDVNAAGSVNCDDVLGHVKASGSVSCGDVEGSVDAGGTVNCEDVGGSVEAGGTVTCGDVGGNVIAGTSLSCGNVNGSIIKG